MTSRIAALVGIHVVAAAGLLAAAERLGILGQLRLPVVVAAVVIFTLVGSASVQVELGRHACAVTVVEAVLIGSLFHLNPVEIVIAAAAGEIVACVGRRQPLLQVAFNVTGATAASAIAVVTFSALPGNGRLDAVAWLSALAACTCYAIASHSSTSAVLSVVENRRFTHVFADSLTPSAAATAVSASLGLLGVVLATVNVLAVLLVAPVVVLMAVETRRLAEHRADHLRFRRLYAASGRTSELTTQDDAMAMLAGEARTLVTGAAGLCCTVDRAGRWHGIVVGDGGARPASRSEVTAALALRGGGGHGEVTGSRVAGALRALATPFESAVFAGSPDGATLPVVIAVVRQLRADEGSEARAEVLGAFIGHAALTLTNARLFADVEEALAHQVDLNRQKDDFVAAVSHELRTPLTAMLGSIASLARFAERLTPDKRTELVDVAARQGDRLKRLIEDVLLLSGVEARGAPHRQATVLDLEAMVGDIARDLRAAPGGMAGADVAFTGVGLAQLRCDEERVRQILVNLVENARKYAPGSPIVVAVEPEADRVLIHVIDEGPGIAPEDREKVFERFVQLDQSSTRAQGGTGLGLYLCRRLADVLGGTIVLSSSKAGGCRFTLSLPCNTITLSADEVCGDRTQLIGAVLEGHDQ